MIRALTEQDLGGTWTFHPEGGETSTITVPGGGYRKQGFTCEAGTYETKITIPTMSDSPFGHVVKLEFEAINHFAEYYIGESEADLVKVYEEVTAFTPQVVDITAYVQPGKTYVLRIFIRSHQGGRPIAPHWAEWCDDVIACGILGGAYLRVYPGLYISDVYVKTSVAADTLSFDTWMTNQTTSDQTVTLKFALSSWNGEAWNYPALPQTTVTVPAGQTIQVESGAITWGLGSNSYWWPNVPYVEGYRAQLHKLELQLAQNTSSVHQADIRFGFRELKQAAPHFELNGVRVNFRGDNLQVANYDRIDHGGKGDAIHTLPGFLPPSAENPGWPKAVDNFLRLNYNVQREHMGPWTPYMIDVCDELGLMLIGESACRWNGFDMEDGRGFHEVKCLEDIIRRDRNHPSIVRWSSKNEAQCLDPAYHVELYLAIRAIDDTRPVYEDLVIFDRKEFNVDILFADLKHKDDFTWIEHYISWPEGHWNAPNGMPYFTVIDHNDAVVPLADRPYGIGEADWMRSSTNAGLTWFAATTALARAQGASDVRPYVLLSSWASSIPGVKTTDFLTEENRHPVYGEDNLLDPWSHAGMQLLQQAYHPLLALDVEFWQMNRKSNALGYFPVKSPQLPANEPITRNITVFNDEFEGDDLELVWELREGSTSNRVFARGDVKLEIRSGERKTVPVTFTAPQFNTFVFLTLTVRKHGKERFRDTLTCYQITGGVDFKPEFNGEERKFI